MALSIEIEVSKKECISLLSFLCRFSLQQHIFVSHRSHRRIHFPQNIVSPSMTSQANSPHSSLLLGHGARKWPNLGTLKNHRKLTKIAATIIFSQRWSKRQKDLYKRNKIWGVSCTLSTNCNILGLTDTVALLVNEARFFRFRVFFGACYFQNEVGDPPSFFYLFGKSRS